MSSLDQYAQPQDDDKVGGILPGVLGQWGLFAKDNETDLSKDDLVNLFSKLKDAKLSPTGFGGTLDDWPYLTKEAFKDAGISREEARLIGKISNLDATSVQTFLSGQGVQVTPEEAQQIVDGVGRVNSDFGRYYVLESNSLGMLPESSPTADSPLTQKDLLNAFGSPDDWAAFIVSENAQNYFRNDEDKKNDIQIKAEFIKNSLDEEQLKQLVDMYSQGRLTDSDMKNFIMANLSSTGNAKSSITDALVDTQILQIKEGLEQIKQELDSHSMLNEAAKGLASVQFMGEASDHSAPNAGYGENIQNDKFLS